MRPPLAANYLMPSFTFLVLVVVVLVGLTSLVIWPLVETVVHRQWGYTLGVLTLGPIGGLVWFVVGRREVKRRG